MQYKEEDKIYSLVQDHATFTGEGILVNPEGKLECEFHNGKATGDGVFNFKNKDQYKGQWKDHKQHGEGVEI